ELAPELPRQQEGVARALAEADMPHRRRQLVREAAAILEGDDHRRVAAAGERVREGDDELLLASALQMVHEEGRAMQVPGHAPAPTGSRPAVMTSNSRIVWPRPTLNRLNA